MAWREVVRGMCDVMQGTGRCDGLGELTLRDFAVCWQSQLPQSILCTIILGIG